jgi:ribosome-binding protein aMBF1 (putative translation factor)
MLDDLVKVGERNKVKPDRKELRKKEKLLKFTLKLRLPANSGTTKAISQ